MPANQSSKLETEVYEYLLRELANRRLGLEKDNTTVRLHPKYYSRDRGSPITADVSLEMSLPKDMIPTLIWIWECKNTGRKLDVADVEEFYAKLEQIGPRNTHGSIACPSGFQRSAIEYANSKRIGLIEFQRGTNKSVDQMKKTENSVLALPIILVAAASPFGIWGFLAVIVVAAFVVLCLAAKPSGNRYY